MRGQYLLRGIKPCLAGVARAMLTLPFLWPPTPSQEQASTPCRDATGRFQRAVRRAQAVNDFRSLPLRRQLAQQVSLMAARLAGVPRKRVRFKDTDRTLAVSMAAFLLRYFRPNSPFIRRWRWVLAFTATVAFFMLPLVITEYRTDIARHVVSTALDEQGVQHGAAKPHSAAFVAIELTLDVFFLLDLLVGAAHAAVLDLGFEDSAVEKLVDAMPRDTDAEVATEQPAALARRALSKGAVAWRHLRVHALYVAPRKLLLMVPLWVAVAMRWPVWARAVASLLRIYRLYDLLRYLSHRQADVASPVRWVALFKFCFIVLGTGHWVGCTSFFLAASSDFSMERFRVNWVDAWVAATHVRHRVMGYCIAREGRDPVCMQSASPHLLMADGC